MTAAFMRADPALTSETAALAQPADPISVVTKRVKSVRGSAKQGVDGDGPAYWRQDGIEEPPEHGPH